MSTSAAAYSEILGSPVVFTEGRLSASEMLQRKHYDRIAQDYEAHYGDACSREYRRRFIYQPMFEGIDVAGMNVLDGMCGSGHTTEYLLSRGARVTGLDISSEEINAVRRSFRILFTQGLVIPVAVARIEQQLGMIAPVQELIAFIRQSTRGINGMHERHSVAA